MGLGAIISALVRWPIQVWPVGGIVIVIVVAGFLTVPQTPSVSAESEPNSREDCLSCHTKVLKGHDKLGSGNKACWVCHGNPKMTMLRLADGTPLSFSDSPQLCGQCHQERYDAWKEGTHGIPAWKEEVPADKAKCTDCHDPHQPQIALLNITEPHPTAQRSPPSPSVELLAVLGIALLFMIAVSVAVATKGERT